MTLGPWPRHDPTEAGGLFHIRVGTPEHPGGLLLVTTYEKESTVTEKTYDIARPTETGLYESEVLKDLVTIRVSHGGYAASAIVETTTATYETAILDFAYYAGEFGPFRKLDDETPEPPSGEPVAPKPAISDSTPAHEPEGAHEAELNGLQPPAEEVAA
ncbi:hypothetical protein SEA_MABODAMACA_32 [Microbacterium phage Mabodamaca]|uniref:Uncharacterized protein n=1 Tax=Microbacterium phage Mabodamaca TaxID=3078574 RepID=A0AA96NFV2_9CAUD|nr:hypothetical protein SEA_MABODAMACA_32 [Microbacterium phage Mabodamaca]